MKANLKKDDTVLVIAGKERGKSGKVVRVMRDRGKVIVERINMIKRHRKPTGPQNPGGIVEKEAPLDVSNVMLLCRGCDKPVRVGRKILDNGSHVRVCRSCGEVIDKG
jgi:large subunit ribosomal protein L24